MDEQNQANAIDNCPGSGSQGQVTYQQGGDDWYVKCPVCGTTWAGGSHVVAPHLTPEDRLKSGQYWR